MRILQLLAFCVVGLLASTESALANNNLFLPGDAFFPTQLTAKDINALVAQLDGPYVFQYSSVDTYEMAFCGDAGYDRIAFDSIDKPFIKNLAQAYTEIRKRQPRRLVENSDQGKTTLEETNGIKVLFYPAEFDLENHAIGLRYNEAWVDEVLKFGYQQSHIRLCCMLNHPMAVTRSWRDAKNVGVFDVTLPNKQEKRKQDPFGDKPAAESTPVIVRGQVKAIIALRESLDDYFTPKKTEYLPLHVVDSKQHGEITRKNGKWVPVAEADSPF